MEHLPEFGEQEVEGLFSGPPSDLPDELSPVAEWLGIIRTSLIDPIPADKAQYQAALAAETARRGALEPARHPQADRALAGSRARGPAAATIDGVRGTAGPKARSSLSGRRRWKRVLWPARAWMRRAMAAGTAVLLFVGAGSGLALAADGAAPGDTLYGLKLAFEKIGVLNGGAVERLTEVEHLVDDGDIHGALIHAETIIARPAGDTEDAASQAVQELDAAAQRVADQDDDSSAEVRARVDDLLQYLSENVGHVDGRQVAQLARNIGGNADEAESPAEVPPDDPAGSSGGPPTSPPSQRP
jgi:hypothetical protein